MPLPPDDIRARLAQLRSEFAMRAALQSEYDKEMSGKYIHEMIPFADWLAQRNAPTGKAKGGLAHMGDGGATPESFDPIENLKRNVSGAWDVIKQVPSNLRQLATDPVEYLKSLPPPTAEQVAYGFMPGKLGSAPLKATVDILPAAQRQANLAQFMTDSQTPPVLYHGTGKSFSQFEKGKLKRTGWGEGFHLAEDTSLASHYAKQFPEGANVMPVHASIKKPLVLKSPADWFENVPGKTNAEKTAWVKSQGYDGIKYQHSLPSQNETGMAWVAFEPTQIKSAIGNRGTYSLKDPNITKASGGSVPSLDVMRLAIGGQGPRNFLKGTVEKVLKPLMSQGPTEADREWLEQHGQRNPEARRRGLEAIPRTEAINQWIERNLGNYIRKQMGHPNDPVRKLAEEGVLHFDPEQLGVEEEQAEDRRQMLGGQKLAKGPLAQAWENAVDYQFEPNTVEDIKAMPDVYKGMHEPWMDKVDPKTTLYELYNADQLGFDHIVDILKEDLAQGRIRPEQLSKVSIEQAVRRTHEVDQANKKAMAEASLKTTEGMPVHKDYGDGFKWIELTLPEMPKELPEGWTMKVPKAGLMRASKPDPVDPRNDITRLGQDLPDLIKNIYNRHPETPGNPFQKLKDALAYESDVMGHCVGGERLPDGTRTGGYANDVKAGNTRIFSLRDAKNEPHVTVEVKPKGIQEGIRNLPDEERFALAKEIKDKYFGGVMPSVRDEDKYWDLMDKHYVAKHGMPPPSIQQIKGKGNAKPKKDYIPYVQDFVKSGNWSNVGDINNAEMRDIHPESDLAKAMQQKGLQAPKYVTEQEMSGLLKEHNQGLYSWKKADGGEVDAEEVFMGKGGKVKELEQYLRQREGEYGVKRLQRAADEIPGLENMYTLQALKEAFGGDNAKALMTMNPADFEKFAVRLFSDPDTREEEMKERIERGHELPPMSHHEYIEHLAKIKGGFADVPFLEVNKRPEYLPNISGHEGRHRSRAMVAKGAQKSLVRLLPSPSMRESMPRRYREDFIEAMKKELGEKRLVTGEGRSLLPADLEAPEHKNIERRNMLGGRPQLPEIYKDGGDVDPESVFFPKSKE